MRLRPWNTLRGPRQPEPKSPCIQPPKTVLTTTLSRLPTWVETNFTRYHFGAESGVEGAVDGSVVLLCGDRTSKSTLLLRVTLCRRNHPHGREESPGKSNCGPADWALVGDLVIAPETRGTGAGSGESHPNRDHGGLHPNQNRPAVACHQVRECTSLLIHMAKEGNFYCGACQQGQEALPAPKVLEQGRGALF